MKIIVVAGTASSVGKTMVASYILKSLSNSATKFDRKREQVVSAGHGNTYQHINDNSFRNNESTFDLPCTDMVQGRWHLDRAWCALKITVRHEGSCPKHTDCDVCDSSYENFKILTCNNIIKEKGKDTYQLSIAGAYKVIWLQTGSNAEKAGIEAALAHFDKEDNVIVEGNSFLRVKDANLSILVASPSVKKIKRSAKLLIETNKIDLIVINVCANHTLKQIEECKKNLLALGCKAPSFVVNPYEKEGYSNQAFIETIQDILGKV